MKTKILILSPFIFTVILLGNSCCLVVGTDNENHRGWYKNSNNTHNPTQ